MNYCEQRLKALNITKELNTWKAHDHEGHARDFRFFTPYKKQHPDGEERDDISINYIAPDGVVEQYETDNRKIRDFARIRLKEPKEDQGKYQQPPHTGTIPFSTPEILKAYAKGEKVKTLYIVEGEFKAFALSNFGLPCFGIGGIQNFRDKDKDELHPYIIDFIKKCKVENVLLIFDADCLKVEWKEGKDLAARLCGFHSAVSTFDEFLKPYDVSLYFAHVVKDSPDKGIDDVLYGGRADQQLVIEELKDLLVGLKERKYVLTAKITGVSVFKVQRIFGIDSVESFFEDNAEELSEHEFVFRGTPYFQNGEGKIVKSWHGQEKNYYRVGIKYYKRIVETSSKGNPELNLVLWSEKNIKDDFKGSKDFFKGIVKCDAFTNVPENDPKKYRRCIISKKDGVESILYNRYEPIHHVPQEGDWNTIKKFLHHIFDYRNMDGETLYEFGLDYIQQLYTNPTQHQPILCLVSSERGTGKSTFLKLLNLIFCENMRILDSQRLMSPFNTNWVGKLIVSVDESFINMDEKNGAGNKLKMIATNDTLPIEDKGITAGEVSNFSKLILCSNDEFNFVKIDMEENRYAIIKVNPLTGEDDPHIDLKMKVEIPAFLHYLKNRRMYYPEKSRLWFEERVYETPALQTIKERTENMLVKNIKDVIREQFFIQKRDNIQLSLRVIFQLVQEQYRFADKLKIAEYLRDHGWKPGNATYFTYYFNHDDAVGVTKKDRCYTFLIGEFLMAEEINELLKSK